MTDERYAHGHAAGGYDGPVYARRLFMLVGYAVGGRVGMMIALAVASKGIVNESAERFPASAHMFIINPLSGIRLDGLFSTHPPVENRIAELEAMAAEMGGAHVPPAPAEVPVAEQEEPAPEPSRPWGRNAAPKKGPWS